MRHKFVPIYYRFKWNRKERGPELLLLYIDIEK